jgi:hypothetical protein
LSRAQAARPFGRSLSSHLLVTAAEGVGGPLFAASKARGLDVPSSRHRLG